MLDFSRVPADELALVDHVCSALVGDDGLQAGQMMIVGAQCRDIIHAALGHAFALRTTADVDCAVVVDDWKVYDELTAAMPRLRHRNLLRRRWDPYRHHAFRSS